MKVKELLEDLGFEPSKEGLSRLLQECEEEGGASYPAVCDEGCWVEPDGSCSHGHLSILIWAGIL